MISLTSIDLLCRLAFVDTDHRDLNNPGAHDGTCTWLLDDIYSKNWKLNPLRRNGVFQVIGNPGAGKTS